MKKLLSLIIIFGILSLSFCAIAQEEPVYLGTAIRSLSNPTMRFGLMELLHC